MAPNSFDDDTEFDTPQKTLKNDVESPLPNPGACPNLGVFSIFLFCILSP
jgi:hypothetical protein